MLNVAVEIVVTDRKEAAPDVVQVKEVEREYSLGCLVNVA